MMFWGVVWGRVHGAVATYLKFSEKWRTVRSLSIIHLLCYGESVSVLV